MDQKTAERLKEITARRKQAHARLMALK